MDQAGDAAPRTSGKSPGCEQSVPQGGMEKMSFLIMFLVPPRTVRSGFSLLMISFDSGPFKSGTLAYLSPCFSIWEAMDGALHSPFRRSLNNFLWCSAP